MVVVDVEVMGDEVPVVVKRADQVAQDLVDICLCFQLMGVSRTIVPECLLHFGHRVLRLA